MHPLPTPRRRTVLAAIAGASLLPGLTRSARAQSYPNKPIRLVVAFGTGSGNDLIAREVAIPMSEALGQSVVVENRAGGGGTIGTEAVARAAPDGYTIGLGTSSQLVMNVGLFKSLPFDVERDLVSVGLIAYTPLVLVASSAMPKTLKELIARARANPGKVTYGSAGPGSISHVVGAAFAKAADIELLHVPYKGNGPALVDLSGGHVDLLFDDFISARPIAQQGRAHLLAVSGKQRSAVAPEVPTFAEQGLPDYEASTWNCLFAPRGTPADVISKLNAALNKALGTPQVKERLAQGASQALGPSTPAQTDAYGQEQRAKWVPFIRSLQINLG